MAEDSRLFHFPPRTKYTGIGNYSQSHRSVYRTVFDIRRRVVLLLPLRLLLFDFFIIIIINMFVLFSNPTGLRVLRRVKNRKIRAFSEPRYSSTRSRARFPLVRRRFIIITVCRALPGVTDLLSCRTRSRSHASPC